MKAEYNGELLLYTCPTVLITSRYETDNVFTVSWTGIASSHPEYVTVAINKKRLSHEMISRTKKFCINIPDTRLLREVDYCGSYSGRDVDKFVNCKFEKIYFDSDYVLIKGASVPWVGIKAPTISPPVELLTPYAVLA